MGTESLLDRINRMDRIESQTPKQQKSMIFAILFSSKYFIFFILFLFLFAPTVHSEELGLKVPPGFRVTLFSDETLANDIYAMTLDAQGRVVVTSRGYVKTLHDTNGDGKADRATVFATTESGGMGLCFDGNDLLFCGDGWLSRYRDADGDGRADGPPERLIPLAFAEHGGHAMRKGPDGFWYVIGGNDSKIGRAHASTQDSPIRDPEAGALLRLNPDGRDCAVIAQGFRNPYDFDFDPAGDLFTYDSDVERDAFLPWYSPTRIYHVGYAGHHGWRLTGFTRSWARRGDYLDTVDILWPVGRGSPTGVVCYRHDQFPEHFRGGVFALDWTFGKVFFLPLTRERSSYKTTAEIFLEPTGTHGFAPTDAVVTPDGSLLISIGGRRTRGAVYRVEYIGEGRSTPASASLTGRDAVLRAAQPLDAWSRARWVPEARKLGPGPFLSAILDSTRDAAERVRAVEVVTELFGGLPADVARLATRLSAEGGKGAPQVRARVAWSLGRVPCPEFGTIVPLLTQDPFDRVRLAALEALADRAGLCDPDALRRIALESLGDPDKRIRQAAARLAAGLPDQAWSALQNDLRRAAPQARLTGALAMIWRHPEIAFHTDAIETALAVFNATPEPELRLQAVRLIVLGLGDWHLNAPAIEVDTAYSVAQPLDTPERAALADRIRRTVRSAFPSEDPRLDDEAGRLLAMLESDDPLLPSQVASFWTEKSDPTRDFHFLVVFSRLKASRDERLTELTARAVLALDGKLQGQEHRTKQSWNDRLTEVVSRLLDRDPRLAEALLRDPRFATPGHVALALCFKNEARAKAARLFLKAEQTDPDFAWSGPLVALVTGLPDEEVRPALRAQWSNFGLRDAIVLRLAASPMPDPADRERFLSGLESEQPQTIRAALSALERLPRDPSAEHMVPALRLLRRLLLEPREAALRARVVALIARETGESFSIPEQGTDSPALRRVYRPVFERFEQAHPELASALTGSGEDDLAAWAARLKSVDWSQGDARRGAVLFESRACQTCHAGSRALGPDLTGVTNRFSREDLFTAIVAPSLDVSPLYRTTLVETRDGQIFSGMVAFESADGLILQTSANVTVRVGTLDIVSRQPGTRSLMPSGLLKDLTPGDLADLYRYLQTLTPQTGAGTSGR
jgi:putative membrane-bound dehydrogenase-like protein